MEDHGIFIGDHLMMICGSKEKAEEMAELYPGSEVWPVKLFNKEWVKDNNI